MRQVKAGNGRSRDEKTEVWRKGKKRHEEVSVLCDADDNRESPTIAVCSGCDITAHLLHSCPTCLVCAFVSVCVCASWRLGWSWNPPASSGLRVRDRMLHAHQIYP